MSSMLLFRRAEQAMNFSTTAQTWTNFYLLTGGASACGAAHRPPVPEPARSAFCAPRRRRRPGGEVRRF